MFHLSGYFVFIQNFSFILLVEVVLVVEVLVLVVEVLVLVVEVLVLVARKISTNDEVNIQKILFLLDVELDDVLVARIKKNELRIILFKNKINNSFLC
jgi:hypothetical protein